MGVHLRAFGLTDVGRLRSRNEDSFAIDPERRLFLVADGMGGHGNGDVASRLAAQAVRRFVSVPTQDDGGRAGPGDQGLSPLSLLLKRAIRSAHGELLAAAMKNPTLAGMGTTLVAMMVGNGVASVAHVGDSRAYLWRNGELSRLTRDHSWVNEQVAAGHLSEAQARSHPLKSVVTRALGGESDFEADVLEMGMELGDRYLICSDGLTTMLADDDIEDCMRSESSLEETCRQLVGDSNARGGVDNITVVLIAVEETDGS